jgi:hypothetical protein
MPNNEGMIVHSQKDIQSVMSFLNSLSLTGIEAARKLATAGQPLYWNQESHWKNI